MIGVTVSANSLHPFSLYCPNKKPIHCFVHAEDAFSYGAPHKSFSSHISPSRQHFLHIHCADKHTNISGLSYSYCTQSHACLHAVCAQVSTPTSSALQPCGTARPTRTQITHEQHTQQLTPLAAGSPSERPLLHIHTQFHPR